MTELLKTEDLTKNFDGLTAVDEVNFSVGRNVIKGIIGPNGAGKTTFFNLLTGNLEPNKGKIYFKDEEITNLPIHDRIRRGMARTYQISNLFFDLSVRENIRLSTHNGFSGESSFIKNAENYENVQQKVDDILKQVELYELKNEKVKNLSHGHQRSLEVAIAMGNDPELLLLDEPTSGLSVKEAREFVSLIKDLKDVIPAILFVSHNIEIVMDSSDLITVLHEGRLLAEGSPGEIEENEEVQEVYLKG